MEKNNNKNKKSFNSSVATLKSCLPKKTNNNKNFMVQILSKSDWNAHCHQTWTHHHTRLIDYTFVHLFTETRRPRLIYTNTTVMYSLSYINYHKRTSKTVCGGGVTLHNEGFMQLLLPVADVQNKKNRQRKSWNTENKSTSTLRAHKRRYKNTTTPKENMMRSTYTRREPAAALTDTVKVCFQLFQRCVYLRSFQFFV